MDRNVYVVGGRATGKTVALRKESVDRNHVALSSSVPGGRVALRKESVDRNCMSPIDVLAVSASLSARRAWIEMQCNTVIDGQSAVGRSPQGERG